MSGRHYLIYRSFNESREDKLAMRNYLLGECQELRHKISDIYGLDFTITSAQYSFKNYFGKLLQSGEAAVEGKTVYAALTPTVVGFDYIVTFIVTIQLDNASQDVATVREDVIVNALKYCG